MDRQLETAGVPSLDLEETDQFGRWHGPAVAVALGLVAAFRAQEVRLGLGFHAFGVGRNAEARAEAYDRADDRCSVGAAAEIGHEGAVDLDLVEGEAAQIAEA
jgi:hypothetical protein